jgi:hypothetical protein
MPSIHFQALSPDDQSELCGPIEGYSVRIEVILADIFVWNSSTMDLLTVIDRNIHTGEG